MFFQQLYNWIKYKTLPPSVLFKNRLFIERDSKTRRIFNNFGLIFRNSKWTNFEEYNLKTEFKRIYHILLFFITLFVVLFFFFYLKKDYYNMTVLNQVAYFFWSCVDCFDYYITFFVWSFGMLFNTFIEGLRNYFRISEYQSESIHFKTYIQKRFGNKNYRFMEDPVVYSKKDYKWLLYNWISNLNQTSTIYTDQIIENLFSSYINDRWLDIAMFYKYLYKTVYFLDLNDNSSFYVLQQHYNKIKFYSWCSIDYSAWIRLLESPYAAKYNSLLFWYYLSQMKQSFLINKTPYSNIRNSWTLNNLHSLIPYYSYLTINKQGLFYLSRTNYYQLTNKLNSFINILNMHDILNNQFSIAKQNRWLYKYSILHRKLFKNSHKLTISKKLINSGFLNPDLTKKNLWLSEILPIYDNKNLFHFFSTLFYNNNSTGDNLFENMNKKLLLNNNLDLNNNLSLLSNYEKSYFWFINRYYNFNILPLNSFSSHYSPLKYQLKFDETSVRINLLKLSYFTYNTFKNTFIYFPEFLDINDLKFNDNFETKSNKKINYLQDLFLLNNEINLLNEDNLNILLWITNPSSFNINNKQYYTYFKYDFNNVNYIENNLTFTTDVDWDVIDNWINNNDFIKDYTLFDDLNCYWNINKK